MTRSARSWLVVPVLDEQAVRKAVQVDPDVVVLDVAEFIADRDKPIAREGVREAATQFHERAVPVFVQVDYANLQADISAAADASAAGIVLLNAATPTHVAECERQISSLGPTGPREIVLSLETGAANWSAFELSVASTLVKYLTLGRADLKMDLRPEPSGEIHLMPYLMQRLILIAHASGRQALGAWWRAPDRGLLADARRTYRAARRGRHIGFAGVVCIDPAQVPAVRRAYADVLKEASP